MVIRRQRAPSQAAAGSKQLAAGQWREAEWVELLGQQCGFGYANLARLVPCMGSADTTTEVCKEQSRTRLKQGDWGQEDTGVLAGAHLAPFWVIRLTDGRNKQGRNT